MVGGKRGLAGLLLLVAGLGACGGCFEKTNTYAKQQALATAVQQGDFMQAELLIAHGAEVNAEDLDGYTPLHYAAVQGQKEVAEILLAHGAEINAKDKRGKTPLQLALEKGHKNITDLLRQHGATE